MAIKLQDFKKSVAQIEEIDQIVIEPQKAKGIYVWDVNGKQYIDALSGICVANVGHSNEKVVQAIKEQVDKYLHVMVYGEYIQKPQYDYALLLKSLLPEQLTQIFYVNSGSEAIEGAIKAAKLYNHKKKIISYKHSYHGSTLMNVSMLSDSRFREDFLPLMPCTDNIEFNNFDDLSKIDNDTCCVIAETIAVGQGVELPKDNYLQKLSQRCKQTNTVLILDEIQTGFGRTGTLFAFEQFGFVPDILCIAKAMGGGLPIGAFIGTEPIMQGLNNHHPLIGHATTYGGNPVCLSAALATLNYIIDNNLLESVKQKGERFKQLLKHKYIKQVRGIGLFNCIELYPEVPWEKLLISCFNSGVIVGTHLFNPHCISIKPPLIVTMAEIDQCCERILTAFDSI